MNRLPGPFHGVRTRVFWLDDDHELYLSCVTLSQLAAALKRKPDSLRNWEEKGVIPRTPYLTASDHAKGVRRLYPVDLAEDIVTCAYRHGIVPSRPGMSLDEFQLAIHDLFDKYERVLQIGLKNHAEAA